MEDVRRTALRPPRPILADLLAPAAPGREGGGERRAASAPLRGTLGAPVVARERRRPLFHPKRGWIRRFERAVSNLLGRAVYPRVPGISRPYGRQLARSLTLGEARIAIPDLPHSFEDTRILLISDPHAGPFVTPSRMEETFERLLSTEPDLILLAGDLTTSSLGEFERHREAFRRLRAPLGVFAVLGNHDHYTGAAAELSAMLERSGIGVLHNRSVRLRRGACGLSLAGVDDLLRGSPDLDAALADTEPPVVLVSHNPDLFFEALRRGVALMLSGHTHGGQIRLPGLPVLVRQSRYRLDEGRYRAGRTELVVSRGLGAVGLPWRVACPPEALLLQLVR